VPRIRGLLLDSGGVLVRPRRGRWNPRFDFEEVLRCHVPEASLNLLEAAIDAGERYLGSPENSGNRRDYHRVVLSQLGIADPSPELLLDLERPLDEPVFEPFPEVTDALSRARSKGLRLGVVTDNWGTSEVLARLYEQVGLATFFDVIVVSEELGCRKPDSRMFDTAAAALELRRGQCLVVDDVADLVSAAIALGYHGVVVVRSGALPEQPPAVRTLGDVVASIA
jgi:putative hydrolase of the HAD superfamily